MKTPSGAKLIDILHVLRSETQPIDGHPDPGALDDCWNEVFETIERADQTEVQRLRAALGHIHAIAQSELDVLQYESQRKTWEKILLTAEEALSTTTEPLNAEKVERVREGDGNE